MQKAIGKKVLITTQSWFYGKDGKQYRAVHGTLKAVHEAGKTLGFIPNRSHANWYVEVGTMRIMGCQVLYFEVVDTVISDAVEEWKTPTDKSGSAETYMRPTTIYITE